ncbi:MAG: SpoIID/LytB domain-containing protein, partial [bacterium]
MMSVCPEALLKAQTIAARNTLMATMGKHHYSCDFHLCADDHCQCYRGSSRETGFSRRVTLETVGEVLTHDHKICDTRYSKACGGIMESFDSVWHGERVPSMGANIDAAAASAVNPNYPADNEKRAGGLIDSFPDVYCNTASAQDVPDYLKYSAKYFRWSFKYSQSQLQGLLNRFPQWSVGEVRNLIPVKRGASGRIEILRIEGSERSVLIKKEYSIRKALSESFLFSSCFYPVIERDERGRLVSVELRGGGWGHGAGLCQIGATMMAVRGKTYPEILAHYYKQTNLAKLWRREIDVEQILAEESEDDYREGDSCFEFFNCYFVNDCPMIRQGVILHAANRNGHFVFEPRPQNTVDLKTIGIPCNFMELGSDEATEKGGAKG